MSIDNGPTNCEYHSCKLSKDSSATYNPCILTRLRKSYVARLFVTPTNHQPSKPARLALSYPRGEQFHRLLHTPPVHARIITPPNYPCYIHPQHYYREGGASPRFVISPFNNINKSGPCFFSFLFMRDVPRKRSRLARLVCWRMLSSSTFATLAWVRKAGLSVYYYVMCARVLSLVACRRFLKTCCCTESA